MVQFRGEILQPLLFFITLFQAPADLDPICFEEIFGERAKQCENMVYIPPKGEVKGFYLDCREVTNGEFAKFLAAHGREEREACDENRPVVRVNFRDAAGYARWVGKRIPTAEEWDAAALYTLNNPEEGIGTDLTVSAEWTDTNYAEKEEFKTIRQDVILSEPFSETAPMHVDDLNDSTTFRCAK